LAKNNPPGNAKITPRKLKTDPQMVETMIRYEVKKKDSFVKWA